MEKVDKNSLLRIGTCSWKYDSWVGLVYSRKGKEQYLVEYAHHFTTVEIDQWFWSLFPGGNVKLPDPAVVEQYSCSVPDDFRFTIKVPNSMHRGILSATQSQKMFRNLNASEDPAG